MKKQLFAIAAISMLLMVGLPPILVNAASAPFYASPGTGFINLNSSNGSAYYLHNSGDGSNLEFAAKDTNGAMHWQMLNLNKNGSVRIGGVSYPANLDVYYSGTAFSLHNSQNNNALSFGTGAVSGPWLISSTAGVQFKINKIKIVEIKPSGLFAQKVTVATSWADYVFNKDYKLMTLADLENYIKQNTHLPNIPTANSVEANGLDLGAMQKKQMEKIEELTLYSIQLDKENKELKSENLSLEKRLAAIEKVLFK